MKLRQQFAKVLVLCPDANQAPGSVLAPGFRPGAKTIAESGYTILEVIMGSVVVAIMLISLYAGFTFGFEQIRLSRQQERATQILQEKTELVRLLTWDQAANYAGYVPTNFQDSYYSGIATNNSGNITYSGIVTVASAPVTETYSNALRSVQVQVSWVYGGRTHSRAMTTYVSQYGMQNYIY